MKYYVTVWKRDFDLLLVSGCFCSVFQVSAQMAPPQREDFPNHPK